MKALILVNKNGRYYDRILDPFTVYAAGLKKRASLDFDVAEMGRNDPLETLRAARLTSLRDFRGLWRNRKTLLRRMRADWYDHYDAVFVDISLSNPRIIDGLKPKVVLLDASDSCKIHRSKTLGRVHLLVKNQVYRDPTMYLRSHKGGRVFAEEIIRLYGGAEEPPDSSIIKDGLEKVVLGWNIGFSKRLHSMYGGQGFRPFQKKNRKIDVHCRINTDDGDYGGKSYYALHRQMALKKVNKLNGPYKVVAANRQVSEEKYIGELRNSKICVSPFGWGEICTRDFEAVACGCLLMKPSVSHLFTDPDIYRPFVTYVPVKWDLSDLKGKCRYYLEHPAERERIAANAGEAYARYFREDRFLDAMAGIVSRIGGRRGLIKTQS